MTAKAAYLKAIYQVSKAVTAVTVKASEIGQQGQQGSTWQEG